MEELIDWRSAFRKTVTGVTPSSKYTKTLVQWKEDCLGFPIFRRFFKGYLYVLFRPCRIFQVDMMGNTEKTYDGILAFSAGDKSSFVDSKDGDPWALLENGKYLNLRTHQTSDLKSLSDEFCPGLVDWDKNILMHELSNVLVIQSKLEEKTYMVDKRTGKITREDNFPIHEWNGKYYYYFPKNMCMGVEFFTYHHHVIVPPRNKFFYHNLNYPEKPWIEVQMEGWTFKYIWSVGGRVFFLASLDEMEEYILSF